MRYISFPLIFILLISQLILPSPLSAQGANAISKSENISNYLNRIYGVDPALVSGDFYNGAARGSILGHPYFSDEEWNSGYLISKGIKYMNLQLKYDIYLNKVALKYVTRDNSIIQILLRSDLIEEFEMGGRKFTRYTSPRDSAKVTFCEVMSEGKVKYLVLKSKELSLVNSSLLQSFEYTLTIKQYLQYKDSLIPFKSLNMLYKLFPDQKKAIKKFVTEKNLIPGSKNLDDRAKIISFCNTLIPAE